MTAADFLQELKIIKIINLVDKADTYKYYKIVLKSNDEFKNVYNNTYISGNCPLETIIKLVKRFLYLYLIDSCNLIRILNHNIY